jgi:hypothetical protein
VTHIYCAYREANGEDVNAVLPGMGLEFVDLSFLLFLSVRLISPDYSLFLSGDVHILGKVPWMSECSTYTELF